MSERVAIYARFSSDLQNPTSAMDQIAALRADIARRFPAWRVVLEEKDEAVSGTSMEGRSGLKRLLAAAQARPRMFDAVVVEDLSRLARNRADSIRLRESFASCDVRVLSAADGYVDPESEGGLFLTGFRELKAEADSKETGRRVRRGVKARTLCGWVSGRRTPFGYGRLPVFSTTDVDRDGRPKRLGVRLEVDPVTGPIVTKVFDRYASGVGLRRIAQELNEAASAARQAKPAGYATSFLRALLLNPVYRGDVVYARTKERKVRVGEQTKRRKTRIDASEWAVAKKAHLPLVSEETWERVASRFATRRTLPVRQAAALAARGRRAASLLSGLVKCGVCGGSYVVWSSGPNVRQRARGHYKRHRRFVCARHMQSGSGLCANATTIEVRDLETRVLDALDKTVLTPQGLAYLASQRREYLFAAARESEQGTAGLVQELREVEATERNLLIAIKSGISLEGLRDEADRLAARRAEIEAVRRRGEALKAIEASAIEAHLETKRLSALREILDLPDLDEVRNALREVIIRVEIGGDGRAFLLMGDGPLDPLPPELSDIGDRASPQAVESIHGIPNTNTPGEQPDGRLTGSRFCVVGATGFEPATS